ncbi:hypothetical protein ACFLRA_04105, partial [Bdellovibrionota bacterium]
MKLKQLGPTILLCLSITVGLWGCATEEEPIVSRFCPETAFAQRLSPGTAYIEGDPAKLGTLTIDIEDVILGPDTLTVRNTSALPGFEFMIKNIPELSSTIWGSVMFGTRPPICFSDSTASFVDFNPQSEWSS